jgi:glycine cleavage system aminomethyltransferase T
VKGFRISYVGEQGWELHFSLSYGLALWDMFREIGITPIGIETYANSRRLEKSLRLQNADLLTDYNLIEAGLARPKVKAADFHGKAAYQEQRDRPHQPAMLCTLTVTDNIDKDGVARFMMGNCPIVDPKTNEVLIDSFGRRSFTTSLVYGPSIVKNIALGYLPHDYCEEGRKLEIEYFNQKFPVQVEAVGMKALYDPTNERMKS